METFQKTHFSTFVWYRYLHQLGVVPIPKSVTKSRIIENLNIFDFELKPEDVAVLDTFDCNGRVCQHSEYDLLQALMFFSFYKNCVLILGVLVIQIIPSRMTNTKELWRENKKVNYLSTQGIFVVLNTDWVLHVVEQ